MVLYFLIMSEKTMRLEVEAKLRRFGPYVEPEEFIPYPHEVEKMKSMIQRGSPFRCWEWQGFVGPDGYGRVKFDGREIRSHQAAWMFFNLRRIPAGSRLMLRCNNRKCCNPNHIFIGTTRWDGVARRWIKIEKK